MKRRGQVIVALDTPSSEKALSLVDRLGDGADFYKVGLELYTWAGPEIVRELVGRGKRIFLDLKMHDIPNTVGSAAKAVASLGVELLTVHTAGGPEMIAAAREGLGDTTRLLGVTVLTSMASEDLAELWGRGVESVPDEVLRLAETARASGADGVVAAAPEVPRLRAGVGDDFLIVVPGIRPAGADRQDQKRVATPAHAVRAGADCLVIGRAITQAADPVAALRSIHDEIDEATGRTVSR